MIKNTYILYKKRKQTKNKTKHEMRVCCGSRKVTMKQSRAESRLYAVDLAVIKQEVIGRVSVNDAAPSQA